MPELFILRAVAYVYNCPVRENLVIKNVVIFKKLEPLGDNDVISLILNI